MLKRIVAICILLCTLFVNVSFAAISSIQADEYFSTMVAQLNSNKVLTIRLITRVEYPLAGVSSCTLQKKENNVWTDVSNMGLPTPSESNYGSLIGSLDCSSYINQAGTGTYRVKVQIYTTGYSRYINSNQQTY